MFGCFAGYQNKIYLFQIVEIDDFSCCAELIAAEAAAAEKKKGRFLNACLRLWRQISKCFSLLQKRIKTIVNHKYFQQGIEEIIIAMIFYNICCY